MIYTVKNHDGYSLLGRYFAGYHLCETYEASNNLC